MRSVRIIAMGLLAWPAAEILAFVLVAAVMGVSSAFFLLILISLSGLLVLRHFSGGVARLRAAAGQVKIAAIALDGTAMAPAAAGILLLIPGFISGVVGVLVLFPVTRQWLLAACRQMLATDRRPAPQGVIDLAPGEWQPLTGPKLPPADRRE